MSFKSWSLANPEKTRGYRLLQRELEEVEASIKENEARLESAKVGVLPKARERFGVLGMTYPIFDGLFEHMTVNNPYGTPLFTEEELALQKQIRERQRNQKAIAEEIQTCERRLNGWDMNWGEVRPGREIEHQEGLYEERDKFKAQLAAYSPNTDHWNWRGNQEGDDYARELSKALLARLDCLPGWITSGKYAGFNDDLQSLIATLEEFFLYHLDIDKFADMRSYSGGWIVRLSDGELAFTRKHYNLSEAIMYTWLTYLDHTWDELVAEKHAA